MCPWIVFGKALTANTQFLWPKLLASRWVDDRYSESVLKAYSESVGGARNKFRDDRVACNMFEARLLIFVLKKFSLFLYENLRRLIQLPKPKSSEWMILEWSQFALDEYSLSVLNVAWMLYEHDEVTGCSLYSVSCKYNAVGLLYWGSCATGDFALLVANLMLCNSSCSIAGWLF